MISVTQNGTSHLIEELYGDTATVQAAQDAARGIPDVRALWREAVAEMAAKAKVALPESTGHIDSAVKIVLNGDVELLDDGKAKVASQSNGQTSYFVVNGACQCALHKQHDIK